MEFSAQRYLKAIINCDNITEIESAWHAVTQELPNLKINCLIYPSQFGKFSFTMRTTVGFTLKEVATHLILITLFLLLVNYFFSSKVGMLKSSVSPTTLLYPKSCNMHVC